MVYYLFWTAYSTWVDPAKFFDFFGVKLTKYYGFEFWLARKLKWIEYKDGKYHLTVKGVFAYHHYEGFYTLRYIDKMWHTLNRENFPKKLKM